MSSFQEQVRSVVKKIPSGSVMTYQQVAKAAGSPKAYRAVANIMAKNFDQNVPCHRVVRSDGSLGGYNRGGTLAKQKLLRKEGAIIG